MRDVSDQADPSEAGDESLTYDPGEFILDHASLRRLEPGLYGLTGFVVRVRNRLKFGAPLDLRNMIANQLIHGDCRAAIVAWTEPLLVAAYTDELDCVVMLRFPQWLVRRYGLSAGHRLVTANAFYEWRDGLAPDLTEGPQSLGRWTNFGPMIVDFLVRDDERLAAHKARISPQEWSRTEAMASKYLTEHGHHARDGSPVCSFVPARR